MGLSEGKYVLDNKELEWFSKNTELSKDDVKIRYEHFVQSYPDGKIPKSVFVNMLQSAYKASKRTSKMQAQGLEKYAYATYDRDGDGCIDFKEFLSVMYILNKKIVLFQICMFTTFKRFKRPNEVLQCSQSTTAYITKNYC